MSRATTAEIKTAVLAYRDGVLESTSAVLDRHDMKQVQTALALQGKEATLARIQHCAAPFHP